MSKTPPYSDTPQYVNWLLVDVILIPSVIANVVVVQYEGRAILRICFASLDSNVVLQVNWDDVNISFKVWLFEYINEAVGAYMSYT